jgi:hypothetical protein
MLVINSGWVSILRTGVLMAACLPQDAFKAVKAKVPTYCSIHT